MTQKLALELNDTIVEYNSKQVLIPLNNIIGANAIHIFQLGMINTQREIIALQFQQIKNYDDALYHCSSEVDLLNEAIVEYEKIISIKDQLVFQERTKLWAYRILVGALATYITIYYL